MTIHSLSIHYDDTFFEPSERSEMLSILAETDIPPGRINPYPLTITGRLLAITPDRMAHLKQAPDVVVELAGKRYKFVLLEIAGAFTLEQNWQF